VKNQGRGAAMMRIEVRNIGLGPEHDWSSHAADALGLMAICYEAPGRTGGSIGRFSMRIGDGFRFRLFDIVDVLRQTVS
jgi:hypothetical protein